MKRLAFLIILIVPAFYATAQPNLVLSKPGKVRHYFYQAGDRISYRDKRSGERFSGTILILNDSMMEISKAPRIRVDQIDRIYRTRYFLAQAAGAGVVVLGVYFPISVINRALQRQHPLINDDVLIVNGSMLAVSGVSALFLNRKFKIGNPWKLKVMDFGRPILD